MGFKLTTMALLLAGGTSGNAAVFESVQSLRTINIGASVGVAASDDSGFFETKSDGDGKSLPGYDFRNEAVGLSGFGLSTPYGSGGGSGRASQESEMNGDRIYFNGFADVYVSASSGGDGMANASGNASSDFYYTFRLAAPTTLELQMSSGAVDEVTSEFTFSLTGQNGTVIWDQIGIERNFQWLTTFSVPLSLNAGEYTVSSHVGASSSYEGDFGFAGQSRAEFTIIPVPEPGVLALSGLGVLVVALLRKRRRQ